MTRYKNNNAWIDIGRMCPRCKSRIKHYRRSCKYCGLLISNRNGKVFPRN